MKKGLFIVLLLAAGLVSMAARADVLVLVHGYLTGANVWNESGITTVLQRHHWRHAGTWVTTPGGIQLIPAAGGRAKLKFYTVDLPSEAPILMQVYQLREILLSINATHAGEPLILAGHSAGGVVARTALVRGDVQNAKALITIASPHLGTERAEQVLDVTDIPFPFSVIADVFAGEPYDIARRSRSLYVDLVRPQPGTLLYWLNALPHPDIAYFSIVRGETPAGWGDFIVPAYSQDMNNVPVLRGRSTLINVPADHGLVAADGSAIVRALAGM